jgi:hypothetical protein
MSIKPNKATYHTYLRKLFISFSAYSYLIICSMNAFGQSNISLSDNKYSSPFISELEFNQNHSVLKIEEFPENNSKLSLLPKFDNSILKELSPSKFINSKWDKIQIDIKSLLTLDKPSLINKKNIHSGGSINLEGYTSNAVLPFSANEATYLRSWGNPNISIFNLPFEMNYFVTTEENNYYHSNSVTFRFDINQFRTNIENAQKAKVEEAKNLYKELYSLESDIEIYKKDLARAKKQYEYKYQNDLENRSLMLRALDNQKIQDSLLDLAKLKQTEITNRVQDSLNSQKDGVSSKLKSKYNTNKKDSIEDEYQKKKSEFDKNLNQFNHYLKIIDSISAQIEHYKKLIQKIRNPDFSPEQLSKEAEKKAKQSFSDSVEKRKKLLQKKLESIEDFEFGLFNTFYSKNTLNGIAIRGINIKIKSEDLNAYSRVSAGFTISELNTSFQSLSNEVGKRNSNKTQFDRRITAIKLGLGNEFDNTLYYISLFSWDQHNSNSDNFKNAVNGFGGNYRWKNIQFNGEILHSIYDRQSNLNQITDDLQINNFKIFKQRLALTAEFKYKLNSTTNTKFKFDQKNVGFRSVGTPFSQNDFRTMEFNLNKTFFKNKLTFQGFYKYLNNNLTKISDSKNELKGMGLTAQTNIKKYPNILIAYYPFEQSNYHIDSVQRTNNKFKSFLVQISYQKSWKNNYSYSFINYNLATIEYHEFGLQTALTKIFSASELLQNDKYRSSFNYLLNLTKPSIDSINYHSINFSLSRKLKKLEFGIDGQQKYTFSHGKSLIHSLSVKYKKNSRFNLSANAGVGYLDKVWSVSNLYYFYSRLNLVFLL